MRQKHNLGKIFRNEDSLSKVMKCGCQAWWWRMYLHRADFQDCCSGEDKWSFGQQWKFAPSLMNNLPLVLNAKHSLDSMLRGTITEW